MKINLKIRFPSKNAASVLQWLRVLPYGTVKIKNDRATLIDDGENKNTAYDESRFLKLFGSLKSDETSREMYDRIRNSRYKTPFVEPPF